MTKVVIGNPNEKINSAKALNNKSDHQTNIIRWRTFHGKVAVI